MGDSEVAEVQLNESFSTSWHTYPSIYAMGHRVLADLFEDDVLVEEKVDGSQFNFGRFPDWFSGKLRCRSKGAEIDSDGITKSHMFFDGVESVKQLDLQPGWTYRGEYLKTPKHNTLAYDRTPKGLVAIFDISTGHEQYLDYDAKQRECDRLGLEVVPRIFEGKINTSERIRELLGRISFLGGQTIEGVVVKNYKRFGPDKKILLGKFVSEAFKEVHIKDWKIRTPGRKDILEAIGDSLRTPARWNKAIQHLRESGTLTETPKDIGPLIDEIAADIAKECSEEIKERLFKWAWKDLHKQAIFGFPQWYKEKLLEKQFPATETKVEEVKPCS